MKIIEETKRYIPIFILVLLGILFIRLLDNIEYIADPIANIVRIVTPFFYAFIIAYVLNPIVRLFESLYRGKRALSVMSTYIIIVVFILILSNYLFPKIGENLYELYVKFPAIVASVREFLTDLSNNEKIINVFTLGGLTEVDTDQIFSRASSYLQAISSYILTQTMSTAFATVKWVFAFFVSIYILVYKDGFKKFGITVALKFLGGDKTRSILGLLRTVHKMIGLYIGTKAIDSLIIGGIALIGLSYMGSPFVFLLAVLVFVTNMVPYFGPFVGMAVTTSVHIFYSPRLAIVSLVFLFLLQQFDAWFLDPRLIGNKVGLNPFLIILAVTIGGGLYGPIGMLLAAPVMATTKIYVERMLKKKRIPRRR